MSWQDVDPKAPLQNGVRYRAIYNIQAPYNSDVVGAVFGALKEGLGVTSAMLANLTGSAVISDVVAVPPAPGTVVAGKWPYWSVYVVFTKKASPTPQVQSAPGGLKPQVAPIVVGAIVLGVIAGILLLVIGAKVLSSTLQHEVVDPTKDLASGIGQAILPVAIIALLIVMSAKGR